MELLVVSQDRPVPDSGGKWRKGEVVIIKPDGYEWARRERDPARFAIVKIPGVAVTAGEKYLNEKYSDIQIGEKKDLDFRRDMVLDLTRLPDWQTKDNYRMADLTRAEQSRA